jgi:hypothetical protein
MDDNEFLEEVEPVMEPEPAEQEVPGVTAQETFQQTWKGRAAVRWAAGTACWRDHQYQVQHGRRRTDEYLQNLRENWETKKDEYNAQRRERRKQAKEEMEKLGLLKKVGRPPNPPEIAAVPAEVAQDTVADKLMVLLPDKLDVNFERVPEKIRIPDDDSSADKTTLRRFMGASDVDISRKPLEWGMFRFAAWKDLEINTRYGYVSAARNAFKEAGLWDDTDTSPNKELRDKYIYFNKETAEPDIYGCGEPGNGTTAENPEEEEVNPAGTATTPFIPRKGKKGKRVRLYSQNPCGMVEFLIRVPGYTANADQSDQLAWRMVLAAYTKTHANNYASGLASVCYTWLRAKFEAEDFKNSTWTKVLRWSEIFRVFTTVTRKNTGVRFAAQLITNPKDVENTVPWEEWTEKAMEFIQFYFNIDGKKVTIKDSILPSQRQHPVYMRDGSAKPRSINGQNPTQPRRPNLKELRDVVIVSLYSLLAPIRLDWAPVTITDIQPPRYDVSFKRNVLFINRDVTTAANLTAYFGQFKNKRFFKTSPLRFPLPKEIGKESELCASIILAFLDERKRVGFKSDCLLPFNAKKADELNPNRCFKNVDFGDRLTDLSYDLTRKSFRDQLMRRSYIRWFWRPEGGKNPLDNAIWEKFLPTVHQSSEKVNRGYIKNANKEYNEWLAKTPRTEEEKRVFLQDLQNRALKTVFEEVVEVDEAEPTTQTEEVEEPSVTIEEPTPIKPRKKAPEPEPVKKTTEKAKPPQKRSTRTTVQPEPLRRSPRHRYFK